MQALRAEKFLVPQDGHGDFLQTVPVRETISTVRHRKD
jgi:hypothetical protein